MAADFNGEPHVVSEDVRRVTFRLPMGIDHVHCYLLRARDGSWILVDAGLGHVDAEAQWRPVLDALDAPVERLLVTHGHPDHLGGAAAFAELTGARVHQGRRDHERAQRVWGDEAAYGAFDDFLRAHGVPEEMLERRRFRLRVPEAPELLDEGDELDGWRVHVLSGHAEGHVVLFRDGVLVAGDTVLGEISPHVGFFPDSTDPLAEFVAALGRIEALAPRLALPGHGPLLDDAAGRARELVRHHDERLAQTQAALAAEPRTAWEVSRTVFAHAPRGQWLFALTETLAHLERLVRLGRSNRRGDRPVRFAA